LTKPGIFWIVGFKALNKGLQMLCQDAAFIQGDIRDWLSTRMDCMAMETLKSPMT